MRGEFTPASYFIARERLTGRSDSSMITNSSIPAIYGGDTINSPQLDITQGSWEAATLLGGGGESPCDQAARGGS